VHELSLIQSLLTIIDEQAKEQNFSKVERVILSCGRLSSVEPQALHFAFAAAAPGTICAGARLELNILPLKLHCFSCEREIECEDSDPTRCPRCGSGEVIVTDGCQELQLLEMDVN
jgi:hydrogenase nickel incorporation protein HypA/HybF